MSVRPDSTWIDNCGLEFKPLNQKILKIYLPLFSTPIHLHITRNSMFNDCTKWCSLFSPTYPLGYLQHWNSGSGSRMSLSYREYIECRYIGLFRISKSISLSNLPYRVSRYSQNQWFFCLYSPKILRKFRKFPENSENPWTKVLNNNNNAENSKKSPKIL